MTLSGVVRTAILTVATDAALVPVAVAAAFAVAAVDLAAADPTVVVVPLRPPAGLAQDTAVFILALEHVLGDPFGLLPAAAAGDVPPARAYLICNSTSISRHASPPYCQVAIEPILKIGSKRIS